MIAPELQANLRVAGYEGNFDLGSLVKELRVRKGFSTLVYIPPDYIGNKTGKDLFSCGVGMETMADEPEEACAKRLLIVLKSS